MRCSAMPGGMRQRWARREAPQCSASAASTAPEMIRLMELWAAGSVSPLKEGCLWLSWFFKAKALGRPGPSGGGGERHASKPEGRVVL